MQLTNRLFFEQVEAMLAEGHEVQIRMKGHSMRPLLRNERDIAVLTPIAKYALLPGSGSDSEPDLGSGRSAGSASETHAAKGITPTDNATDSNTSDTRENPAGDSLCPADNPASDIMPAHSNTGTPCQGSHTARGTRHPAPPTGIGALRPGDVVLFRCEGRHILHRIVRIETGIRCEENPPVCAPAAGNTQSPAVSTKYSEATASGAGTLRFTLAGDGNYRMTEHCLGKEIVAVMTAVILPSGHIVRTDSPRWKRRSRRWLALPQGVRRFVLRVMWRLGVR